jgi:hypothetical protein
MGYWASIETWSAWVLTALSAAAATAFIVTGLFEDFFQMARSAEARLTPHRPRATPVPTGPAPGGPESHRHRV